MNFIRRNRSFSDTDTLLDDFRDFFPNDNNTQLTDIYSNNVYFVNIQNEFIKNNEENNNKTVINIKASKSIVENNCNNIGKDIYYYINDNEVEVYIFIIMNRIIKIVKKYYQVILKLKMMMIMMNIQMIQNY